jgi:PAS domain S-box-containing protein
MVSAADPLRSDRSSYLQNILASPEQPELCRLTNLVGHLFRVPVAYMALLGTGDTVVSRIGTGVEYAPCLGSWRLDHLLVEPQLVRDVAELPAGTDLSDLRFAASALLRSSTGLQFGILVIADHKPRPEFSDRDYAALAEVAGVLSGRMELRLVASLALESELSLLEGDERHHVLANCAPVPLIYRGANGECCFVNQAWLDFSGRSWQQEMEAGWTTLIHPDYRTSLTEEYWRSFEAVRPFVAEAPLLRHDGQYRWMLSKGAPKFRHDGSFDGYVGVLIDIADYRCAEYLSVAGCRKRPEEDRPQINADDRR